MYVALDDHARHRIIMAPALLTWFCTPAAMMPPGANSLVAGLN